MTSLHLDGVAFAWSSAVPVFSETTLHLGAGWTGVVGANGAGKSTLLRLLAGLERPGAGFVRRAPSDGLVVLCPQQVEVLSDDILAFASAWDADAERLKARLGLDLDVLERWETLSPGERKRWQVGAALAARADVLLLDEPTNHLDGVGQRLLLGALREFQGVGVIVCHNEGFLDALTTATVRVEGGAATLYAGSLGTARATWEAEAAERRRGWEQLDQERRRLERRLVEERRQRADAERQISTRHRVKGPQDHDGRSMAAKGRAISGEAAAARRVTVTRGALERTSEALSAFTFGKELGRSLFVDYEPAPRHRLVTMVGGVVMAGERPLLDDVRLWLDRDDRVWVAGDNGAGKTTLIRALMAEAHLPPERVLEVPQDIPAAQARRRLDEVLALPPAERGRVMQLVAALGVDPERLFDTPSPSPGEARKLEIAFGLARRVWLLVLDEPTNHLDQPATEALEAALTRWPGALLLVSHDEAFARRCTARQWWVGDGRVTAR